MTRKIPIISLKDFEAKAKKPVMMKSLVVKIGVIISVPKSEWKSGLENAINYYIEKEEYEECSKIKKLIDKIQ